MSINNLIETDLGNFHRYRSNPEVTRYQGFGVLNKEECAEFIESQLGKLFGKPGEWVQYAIRLAAGGQLIGDCAIKLEEDDPRIAQVGITISHLEQGQGYGKEVLLGIMQFLFGEIGVHRIVETADADNAASIALLESCGFRKEGHFIENIFFKGAWGSEVQYAMLKREFEINQSK
ncbi:MAG: GNAT family N-acetyltransferase [Bacteroidia bacterium]